MKDKLINKIKIFKNTKIHLDCCSVGMFGAKFLCILHTFFKIYKTNLSYLDEFVCVLSDLPTVITSLVLSFQEAKAVGRFFVCF